MITLIETTERQNNLKMKLPSVEVGDELRDDFIKNLLDEEKEEKASKKQKKVDTRDVRASAPAAVRKGKTFAEIEAEEGGPIKESLVGMAQTKRALDRKKRDNDVGDTELVSNTERYEEDTLEVEEEDGIKFEPFNLKQEREEGSFDEDGNYVFRKQTGEEGEEEEDAWLESGEAKVVSAEVRRRIEAERARAEEAARRGPLTERQIAQRKADMAGMMQPGEAVARALKRLGGGGNSGAAAAAGALPNRVMGKRERARLLAQQQEQQQKQQQKQPGGSSDADPVAAAPISAASAAEAEARRAQFILLTELADELLEEGELEIYSATQEELLRSARMWLPQLVTAAAPPAATAAAASGGSVAGGAGPSGRGGAAAEDDDDDDMFADDKEDEGAGGAGGIQTSGANVAVDKDEDMFADDDDDAGAKAGAGAATAGSSGNGDGAAASTAPAAASAEGAAARGGEAGPGPASAAASGAAGAPASGKEDGDGEVDYGSWPIKELKRVLQERGVDPSGFVEKADLVAKVKQVLSSSSSAAAGASAAAGPGSGADGSDGAAFVAPPGYVFDPSSGYFYCEEAGMYYDTSSGGYCQAATGKWFYLDSASGAFVEWRQQ